MIGPVPPRRRVLAVKLSAKSPSVRTVELRREPTVPPFSLEVRRVAELFRKFSMEQVINILHSAPNGLLDDVLRALKWMRAEELAAP